MRVSSAPAALPVGILLTGMIASGITGCSSARTPEKYCAELQAGYTQMQQHAKASGKSTLSQVTLLFTDLAEYNRMLHRLDDLAPEEIRSDFSTAVKSWDAQSDKASRIAENPISAIAGTLMSSLMASASFQAVDTYSQQHCGRTVFGPSTTASAGTGTITGAAGCPANTPSTDPAKASFTDLTGLVTGLKGASDPAVSGPAGTVSDTLAGLGPRVPATAREGLSRAAYAQPQTFTAALTSLTTATQKYCGAGGTGALGAGVVGPLRDGPDDATLDNLYATFGICPSTSSSGVTPALKFVAVCDGTVHQIDLISGAVADGPAVGHAPVTVTGERIAWVEVVTTPATGLSEPSHRVVLHLADPDGKNPVDVPVVDGAHLVTPPSAAIVAGAGDLILVGVHESGGTDVSAVYRTSDGRRTGSLPADKVTRYAMPAWLTASVINLTMPSAVVDLTRPEVLSTHGVKPFGDGGCGIDGAFEDFGRTTFLHQPGSGSAQRTPSGAALDALAKVDQLDGIGATAAGLLLSVRQGGFALRAPSGQVLWSLPSTVAAATWVSLGWVVVRNHSDQKVVVNPFTGKEATGLDAETRDLITTLDVGQDGMPRRTDLTVSPERDEVVVVTHNTAHRLVRSHVCAALAAAH